MQTNDKKDFYWLNEKSETFLERGYLLDGVTPKQRIKQIADHAEQKLGIAGFSDKFYKYMSRGYYSLASPVWANYGLDRGLPISCLTGDSWINTENEGGKKIKDIEKGDKVLTHKGRYKKVIAKQVQQSNDNLYELKVKTRMTPIRITGNHKIKTNRGWVRVDELNDKNDYIATNNNIEWDWDVYAIKLEHKKQNDRYPTRFKEKDISGDYIVDEKLAWALGLWFAEGSLSRNQSSSPNGIRITMGLEYRDSIERWASIFEEKFNVNSTIYEGETTREGKKYKWLNCNINSGSLGRFFEDNFGKNCKTKIIPEGLNSMRKSRLKKFLDGFYLGDGQKTHNQESFTISNPKLALSLYEIGLKCDYKMGLQMQQKSGKLSTTKYVYKVNIYCNRGRNLSRNNCYSGIEFYDGLRYAPFSLTKLNYNEKVYDITVEDDHSFSVAGVVVHNCFNSHIEDTMESILFTHAEVGMMTKVGGGTSGYFGDLRGRGEPVTNNGTSNGSYAFAKLFDREMDVISQGSTRRGFFAGYIDIEHKDIDEWLNIQHEGDEIQGMMYGVCVGDEWMQQMIDGDEDKRKTWAKVLQNRIDLGVPYIFFRDTVNDNAPQVYKDKGRTINSSNLCSEVALSSNKNESFVCCLSSMNLAQYGEWKDTDAVEVLTYFLDSVMQEFIDKVDGMQFMERTVEFAKNQRAIGIGALGWHSYLQSQNIAFDSFESMQKNNEIFKTISERSRQASQELADLFGEPPMLEGYGRRNVTTMAVAPTKSSSFILGQVSPSIEPIKSNYFVRDRAKIKTTYKNPHLKNILQEQGKDTKQVWESIALNDGSVQHLDFLTDHQKDVFKTFKELSQMSIVNQAAQRQKHIDQSQSLNLAIDPDNTPVKDINKLYIEAWKKGVKTLYYQHSVNSAQEFSRNLLSCSSCEG